MTKDEDCEALEDGFAEFAAAYPQSALVLITSMLVGLLEYSVKSQGGDETVEIKIEGEGCRHITIHAIELEKP